MSLASLPPQGMPTDTNACDRPPSHRAQRTEYKQQNVNSLKTFIQFAFRACRARPQSACYLYISESYTINITCVRAIHEILLFFIQSLVASHRFASPSLFSICCALIYSRNSKKEIKREKKETKQTHCFVKKHPLCIWKTSTQHISSRRIARTPANKQHQRNRHRSANKNKNGSQHLVLRLHINIQFKLSSDGNCTENECLIDF